MQKLIYLIIILSFFIVGCTKSETNVPLSSETNSVVDEEMKMSQLQVDQIEKITIMEPNNGDSEIPAKTLVVLVDQDQFQTFSTAIMNAEIATGEVIAIGANYDFVVEFSSVQQRFSYWNGQHLKMISDHDTKKSYFLSDEATTQIDTLISEAE